MNQLPMPRDIIHEIILHMDNYKELYNFVKAINYLDIDEKIVKELGKRLIMKRLRQLDGIDANPFCKQLIQNECIITGSFPLQCLLGENWKDSDIDIYSKHICKFTPKIRRRPPYRRAQSIETYLWSLFILQPNIIIKVRTSPLYVQVYDYDGMPFIQYYRQYNICNKIVQVIIVEREDLEEYVKDEFDLTFCQIIFNGKEVKFDQSWMDIVQKIGRVRNINKMRDMVRFEKTKKRIKKYKNRGFTIID